MHHLLPVRDYGCAGRSPSGAGICSYAHDCVAGRSLRIPDFMDFYSVSVAPQPAVPLYFLPGVLGIDRRGSYDLFSLGEKEAGSILGSEIGILIFGS